jgi:hypothetical protein
VVQTNVPVAELRVLKGHDFEVFAAAFSLTAGLS